MVKKALFILFLVAIIFIGCDSDPCDEGYTQTDLNGSDVCLPDHVVNSEIKHKNGTLMYHEDFGAIRFNDGNWVVESTGKRVQCKD